MVKLDVLIADL